MKRIINIVGLNKYDKHRLIYNLSERNETRILPEGFLFIDEERNTLFVTTLGMFEIRRATDRFEYDNVIVFSDNRSNRKRFGDKYPYRRRQIESELGAEYIDIYKSDLVEQTSREVFEHHESIDSQVQHCILTSEFLSTLFDNTDTIRTGLDILGDVFTIKEVVKILVSLGKYGYNKYNENWKNK